MKSHCYVVQVPVVVNSNTAQVLVVTEIPLTPPAFKIHEIDKLIEIDDSLSGRVVVCVKGAPRHTDRDAFVIPNLPGRKPSVIARSSVT